MSKLLSVQEAETLWTDGKPFAPAVDLSQQSLYAFVLCAIGLIFSALGLVSNKSTVSGTIKGLGWAIAASVAFGFGSVFLMNAVGVYA